ncbi:MAG: adenylyltransferase/cytidyltransferase family protein [Verrucomicrobia bacterium]|nr:adenylyltransferase/cytidyltransferase family protein [Verrucomicrobiota bacterium]
MPRISTGRTSRFIPTVYEPNAKRQARRQGVGVPDSGPHPGRRTRAFAPNPQRGISVKAAYGLPTRRGPGKVRALNFQHKILGLDRLPEWRAAVRAEGKRLVVTNGCFDLLHYGHVAFLELARNQGDALLVGVNGDHSVRELKGEGRPINPESDRAAVLAALQAVDGVSIFPERTATHFLRLAQPDLYVKGGDYTLDSLNPEERQAVQGGGGRIVIVPYLPGRSTTGLLGKISRL